jgi:radical SAM superfamily enzyme YgiQ (UPF0313 family)
MATEPPAQPVACTGESTASPSPLRTPSWVNDPVDGARRPTSKEAAEGASAYRLTEKGPEVAVDPRRPGIALLNANPFAEGIANLGAQVVAQALLDAGFNVSFGFADTVSAGRLFGVLPLRAHHLVAMSVPFEDTYHHVPRMLRDIGVPAWSCDRDDDDPIVIAGGLALINPMPLTPFFDAVVVGEGRTSVVEIARLVEAGRLRRMPRREIIRSLAQVPHTFVPSLYHFEYDDEGSVVAATHDDLAPATVSPGRPLDMDVNPIHSIWTTERACYKYPDYYSIMVAMGCHLKCPFCVVGNVQGAESGRALNMAADTVVGLALARRRRFGTNLIKLFFASSFSSQTTIDPLSLKNLLRVMLSRNFTCRVGSLNIRQADEELLQLVGEAGQTRVTFAPETGASLRPSIGKSYSKDEKLLAVAEIAGRYGLGLDLYTMLGVPGEQPQHVRELAELIAGVRAALHPAQSLEVSINPAFSKAQTPYERRATLRPEEVRSRFAYLRRQLPTRAGIEWVTVIDDAMAYYQPILALGGPELAPVLDRLSRSFRPGEDEWRRAIAHEVRGGDVRYFRHRDPSEVLPWQHLTYNSHEKLAIRLDAHRTRAAKAASVSG